MKTVFDHRAAGLLLTMGLALAGPLAAQAPLTEHTITLDDDESRYVLDLAKTDWLVGTWRGEGFGGTVEEVWLPAAHEQMIGAFRYYGEEEPGFSELMTLAHVDGQTLLRVKHSIQTSQGGRRRRSPSTFDSLRPETGFCVSAD